MKTQSTTATDCRCKACGALLAKRDRDGLTIRRGDMQVVVSGDSTVAVTCYRDRCRTLNVLASRTPMPPTPANALPRASAA
jgi:phage FluMu protein Com